MLGKLRRNPGKGENVYIYINVNKELLLRISFRVQ